MGISVKQLEKWHPGGTAPVLQGMSFDVAKGAIAAVMGRSGAGKSSLLRCLTGGGFRRSRDRLTASGL